MLSIQFILSWLRQNVLQIVELLRVEPQPVLRPLSQLATAEHPGLSERDRTLLGLNRLAEELTHELLELAKQDSFETEAHPEEFLGSLPDDDDGSDLCDAPESDATCGTFLGDVRVEVRNRTARVVMRGGVETVDIVIEIFFGFVKDLSAPSAPECPLDEEGDRFWNRLRYTHGGIRYEWRVGKIVIHNDVLYDVGIDRPSQVLEGDELLAFVAEHFGAERFPTAVAWELEDLRGQFERHWPQYSSH